MVPRSSGTFSNFSLKVVEQLQQQPCALALGNTGLHLDGLLLLTPLLLLLQSAEWVLAGGR